MQRDEHSACESPGHRVEGTLTFRGRIRSTGAAVDVIDQMADAQSQTPRLPELRLGDPRTTLDAVSMVLTRGRREDCVECAESLFNRFVAVRPYDKLPPCIVPGFHSKAEIIIGIVEWSALRR